MSTATVIMNGLIKITIILCVAGAMFRLLEIADTYFNKKDSE